MIPADLQLWPGAWVGFDFDGTLATSVKWDPETNTLPLGEPIAPMVDLARAYLAAGVEVRIMTAHVGVSGATNAQGVVDDIVFADAQSDALSDWAEAHLGKRVRVTAYKDLNMVRLYDDRAVQVVRDAGVLPADRLKAWLDDDAAEPCAYGDDCPPFGTRHGQCRPCRAREVLATCP